MVRALLADLVARGLRYDDGLLVVLDGAKALSAAVREVFGAQALIQRCTLHKRRNVADHLPDKDKAWVDAKLVKAFVHPDPDQGLRSAKDLAGLLANSHPGAAASLLEGLHEMFTVARLGIDGRLAKTLTTSNPVESMISIARSTNRNVTRWRDGQMVLRWTAAGMLNAERSFPPHHGLQADAPARCLPSTDTPTRTPPQALKSSVPPPRIRSGSPLEIHADRDTLSPRSRRVTSPWVHPIKPYSRTRSASSGKTARSTSDLSTPTTTSSKPLADYTGSSDQSVENAAAVARCREARSAERLGCHARSARFCLIRSSRRCRVW